MSEFLYRSTIAAKASSSPAQTRCINSESVDSIRSINARTLKRFPRESLVGDPLHGLVDLVVHGADQSLQPEKRLVGRLISPAAADHVQDLVAGVEDVPELVGDLLLDGQIWPAGGLGEGDGFIVHSP